MSKIRIFALGGLDEDGKNMYVVENNEDIFVMECGLKYPDGDQLGIEMIIPDSATYVRINHALKQSSLPMVMKMLWQHYQIY